MRYLGYADWLEEIGQALNLDADTLMRRHVNPVDALNCLRLGGGAPISTDTQVDTAHGCYRLMMHLMMLHPYRGNDNDIATFASITAYARKRGFELDLGRGHMHFITDVHLGDYTERQAVDALRKALRPTPNFKAQQFSLEGVRVAICGPVSNPTRKLIPVVRYLSSELEKYFRRRGAIVTVPRPTNRLTSKGVSSVLPYVRSPLSTTSTSKILTRSIDRVCGADVVFIIMDPRSQGSSVEREWALRCRIPVFELELSEAVHPHAEAPEGVTSFPVDPTRAGEALDQCLRATEQRVWEISDSVAAGNGYRLKNEDALGALRTAWAVPTNDDKNRIAKTLGMSRAYIDGLLSNHKALELASDQQRSGLESYLNVPSTRALPSPGALTRFELRTLTDAGTRAGLDGLALVEAVQGAGQLWRRSNSRAVLRTAAEADESIAAALEVERNRRDDGWHH